MTGSGSRPALLTLLPLAAALGGCAPVPVDQAERSCLRDVQQQQPYQRTTVGIGVGTDFDGDARPYGGISFEMGGIGSRVAGRDPADAFASCVQRRAGRPPSVPLYDQPGWQG